MREIKFLIVFSGKDAIVQDLSKYDKVVDCSKEFESSIVLIIDFYKNGKVVRTLYNPSCDVRYKE